MIGDIHGCTHSFNVLLSHVAPTRNDTVIMLGDYIDRGPDAKGAIDRLLELSTQTRLICLRGNHEQMMLNARGNKQWRSYWRQRGGDTTLYSYARHRLASALDSVPDSHWDFLENQCVLYHETDEQIFVHAGLDPQLPLENQPHVILLSQKFRDARPHCSGKKMICGHTVQLNGLPAERGFALCLDTGVCWGGLLTCLDMDSGVIWQTTQFGETRRLNVAHLPLVSQSDSIARSALGDEDAVDRFQA